MKFNVPEKDRKLLPKGSFEGRKSSILADVKWVVEHLGVDVTPEDAPSGGAWDMLEDARMARQGFLKMALPLLLKREDEDAAESAVKKRARIQAAEVAQTLAQLSQDAETFTELLLVLALLPGSRLDELLQWVRHGEQERRENAPAQPQEAAGQLPAALSPPPQGASPPPPSNKSKRGTASSPKSAKPTSPGEPSSPPKRRKTRG